MKHTIVLVFAVVIAICSVAGLLAAWFSDVGSVDNLAAIQTCCFAGMILACCMVGWAGDSADKKAAIERQ